MSNFNQYRTNMISAISLLHDMDRLKIVLANMEQSYKLWCHQKELYHE